MKLVCTFLNGQSNDLLLFKWFRLRLHIENMHCTAMHWGAFKTAGKASMSRLYLDIQGPLSLSGLVESSRLISNYRWILLPKDHRGLDVI